MGNGHSHHITHELTKHQESDKQVWSTAGITDEKRAAWRQA
jgi:hypothetical protein